MLKPPDAKTGYILEVVHKLETLVQSFTTFASTALQHPSAGTDQILLAMPLSDKMHLPRVCVLN